MYSFDKSDFFPCFFLLRNSVILTVCTLLCVQDIRRFFAPTSAKPAVQKPAPNGNDKQEKKKKKNSSSTDEEVKKKKKEANKVRSCPLSLSPFSVPLHPVYPALLWFRVL